MYIANEYRFGYFVIRNTWENFVAEVVTIEGVTEGNPIQGKSPYFNNPKVFAKIYKVEGAAYLLKPIESCTAETFHELTELSSPGTYAYRRLI